MACQAICCIKGCDKTVRGHGLCPSHLRRLKIFGNPVATFRKQPNGTLSAWLLGAIGRQSDECIEWPFGLGASGYGALHFRGRNVRASRVACILTHGEPINDQMEAAHSCGNRRCVNPRHLRWATPSENQMDRVLHGTSNRGSRNPSSRLTEEQVRQIRLDVTTTTMTAVAERFGVSIALVSCIAKRKRWAWLE